MSPRPRLLADGAGAGRITLDPAEVDVVVAIETLLPIIVRVVVSRLISILLSRNRYEIVQGMPIDSFSRTMLDETQKAHPKPYKGTSAQEDAPS